MTVAVSITPTLIDALYATFSDALDGELVTVYDGYALTEDPGTRLEIGVDDPYTSSLAPSAQSAIEWATYGAGQVGGIREQRGDITCSMAVLDGDSDAKSARDNAYYWLGLCAAAIKADLSLGGVEGLQWVRIASDNLYQGLDEDGASCVLVFTINFYAYLSS